MSQTDRAMAIDAERRLEVLGAVLEHQRGSRYALPTSDIVREFNHQWARAAYYWTQVDKEE